MIFTEKREFPVPPAAPAKNKSVFTNPLAIWTITMRYFPRRSYLNQMYSRPATHSQTRTDKRYVFALIKPIKDNLLQRRA